MSKLCAYSKYILSEFGGWVCPEQPARLVRRFVSGIHEKREHQKTLSILQLNDRFKNLHKGKKCFVLGNGPSNNLLDLALLSGEITIACNHFYKFSMTTNWSPTYYCTGDPFITWSAIGGKGLDLLHLYWNSIVDNTDCNAYFSHISCKDPLFGAPPSVHANMYYWSPQETIDETSRVVGKKIDFSTGTHTPIWLTPMLSVNLAIYMGCNPIYLVGCDTNYLTEFLKGNDYVSHFYHEDDVERESQQKPMSQIIYETSVAIKGFEQLSSYATYHSINILDLTPNGFLRCFPKGVYSNVLT